MPIQIGERTFYTVEDVSEITGWHPQTVRDLLGDGRLKGKKQGKRWYVSERNLQLYFDEEPQENEA